MGLQISCSVYTEAKEEADFRGAASAVGEIFHELARHKESKIVEGHLMGGSRAYMSEYSAEVCGGECGRIHQGEECYSDRQDVWCVLRKNLSGLTQVEAPARNHDVTHPEQGAPTPAGTGEADVGVL